MTRKDTTPMTDKTKPATTTKPMGKAKPTANATSNKAATYKTVITAEAPKISPKATGRITYELLKDKTGALYLRLTGNSSSGNFCTTPVSLAAIATVLEQQGEQAFTSRILKQVFQGQGSKNSNNTAFLMAALRAPEPGLVVADKKQPLLSRLAEDYAQRMEALLKPD